MLRIDDLENKSVLVTGAGTGIGAAVSRACARQGARVAVHWHSNRTAADALVEDLRGAGGTAAAVQGDTAFHSTTPPERMEAMRKTVYLGRIGTPGDCVGAFLFLASQQLSGYITGQIIHVNGGQVMP
jgi:3-oxoacyl-[acyl-carrier protein] reductase